MCTGIIKTKFSEQLWNSGEASDNAKQNILLKRFGSPHECAGIVALFSDPKYGAYITGETVVVGGGYGSRL